MRINRQDSLKAFGIIIVCILALQSQIIIASPLQKNVLFIVVDDLRPQMGCYEKSLPLHSQSLMKTPSMDKLASEGVLFERAYCAVPVCAASRLSILTGSRPYKEPGKPWGRQWAYYSRLDDEARSEPARINHPGNSITMPQHFKNNGY